MTKKEIYGFYGLDYDTKTGKVNAGVYGWINPVLINGNAKLGKNVWTRSTLPGTGYFTTEINGAVAVIQGTCKCDCAGCYAKTGFYKMQSTVKSLALKTDIARRDPDLMKRLIIAQIHADKIKFLRIHAAGDFFGAEYVSAWREIVKSCPDCIFWTYTKNPAAENAFNDLSNINIVKSCIPGAGFNFGHCDYIIDTYNKLSAAGENPYICKCGFDNTQHCNNCTGCSKNKYVLFLEHSTSYNGAADPLFTDLYNIVINQ